MSYPAGHWRGLAGFPAVQPPGADSANVPTQESWTSDRKQAQLSQGHYKSASPLNPMSPPYPKTSPGTFLYVSLRQTILLIDILLHHTPFSPPLPSTQLPIISRVLLEPSSNWAILLAKRAMINSQAVFAWTTSCFHVEASVFLTLLEHVWIKCSILNTSGM